MNDFKVGDKVKFYIRKKFWWERIIKITHTKEHKFYHFKIFNYDISKHEFVKVHENLVSGSYSDRVSLFLNGIRFNKKAYYINLARPEELEFRTVIVYNEHRYLYKDIKVKDIDTNEELYVFHLYLYRSKKKALKKIIKLYGNKIEDVEDIMRENDMTMKEYNEMIDRIHKTRSKYAQYRR